MRLIAILVLLVSTQAFAKTYEDFKNEACPDAWAINGSTIRVITPTVNPWGVATDDKTVAKTHLWAANPIRTLDDTSITSTDLIEDELTVASECLEYRNLVVDGIRYYPPVPAVERKPSNGFIPASVF